MVGVDALFYVSVRSVAVGAIGFDGAMELSAFGATYFVGVAAVCV